MTPSMIYDQLSKASNNLSYTVIEEQFTHDFSKLPGKTIADVLRSQGFTPRGTKRYQLDILLNHLRTIRKDAVQRRSS